MVGVNPWPRLHTELVWSRVGAASHMAWRQPLAYGARPDSSDV